VRDDAEAALVMNTVNRLLDTLEAGNLPVDEQSEEMAFEGCDLDSRDEIEPAAAASPLFARPQRYREIVMLGNCENVEGGMTLDPIKDPGDIIEAVTGSGMDVKVGPTHQTPAGSLAGVSLICLGGESG
jgi:hypothetical protein